MSFVKDINLFDLTDKVLHRFRSESGFKLTGYEFEFKFHRDWNCPTNRIIIDFYLFGEKFAYTVFDEKYDTVDKVIDLLFIHLRDDAGMDDLKEGLISAKRHSIASRTEGITNKIQSLSSELIIDIDEKNPQDSLYENGFPKLQYQVYTQDNLLKLHYDLEFNLKGFDEKQVLKNVMSNLKNLH